MFLALRRARLSRPYVLGDLPLIVLHRGRRTDAVLDQRESEMSKMSLAGVERIATDKLRMVVVKVMRGIHTLYLELEPNWKN